MKNTTIKIFALILTLSVIISLLCGCGVLNLQAQSSSPSAIASTNAYTQPASSTTSSDLPVSSEEPSPVDETAEKNPLQIPQNQDLPQGSTLTVYFMDVGQADAALLCCDGEYILIDGGNSSDSSYIYSFLKQHNADHLKYIICTHPHEDHVGGLAGALNYASVEHALCSRQSYDSKAFESFVKYLDNQNLQIEIPAVGDTFYFGSASATVLGPMRTAEDINNESIVLYVRHGQNTFLFTGDAEREEEQDILDTWDDVSADVLKVGHHGSADSTTYPFLRAVAPSYGVISVGTGNAYGHPTEDTLSRLRDADVTTFRTDLQGTITCTSDGTTLTFSTEKNGTATTPDRNAEDGEETTYILNTRSMKFHLPTCASVDSMSEKNKAEFTGSREDLIEQGYTPCGNCNP